MSKKSLQNPSTAERGRGETQRVLWTFAPIIPCTLVLPMVCLQKPIKPFFIFAHAKLLQSYLTLCQYVDCSPPGSSTHGTLQAGMLEWVSMISSRGSSQPRVWTPVSMSPAVAGGFLPLALLLLLFSCLIVCDILRSHGLQHARPPCLLPSPKVCPSSCPLQQWCHPVVSSSDILFSFCPQSFPASGTFSMSWLFTSGDQNTGASASASVLPMSIQGLFPLRLTGLISLLSKGLLGVFSSTRFKGINSLAFCLLYNYMWPVGRS